MKKISSFLNQLKQLCNWKKKLQNKHSICKKKKEKISMRLTKSITICKHFNLKLISELWCQRSWLLSEIELWRISKLLLIYKKIVWDMKKKLKFWKLSIFVKINQIKNRLKFHITMTLIKLVIETKLRLSKIVWSPFCLINRLKRFLVRE